MGKPQNVKNEGYVTLTTFPFELASTRQSASNRWLLIGHADTGWAESKASSTQNHRNCCEGRISCRTWWPHSLSVQRVAASAADNDGRQSVKVDNRLTTGPRYTSINKPLSWAHITWHILPTVPKLVPVPADSMNRPGRVIRPQRCCFGQHDEEPDHQTDSVVHRLLTSLAPTACMCDLHTAERQRK